MLKPRIAWITLVCLVMTPRALAQDGEEARRARPAPPPIMVTVLTSGRMADVLVESVESAVVEQVRAMSGGRPVHALGAPALREALSTCADDACIGALLAEAGAQAGVLVRIAPRPRRAYAVQIELRDPVSGAPRLPPLQSELPVDPSAAAEAARALAAELRDAMPSPPPRPATLLVTVDVDGAEVTVDGEPIGTSPVAPVEVTDGTHDVSVRMPGYLAVRRQVRVQPGEQARVDVTLAAAGIATTEPADVPATAGDVTGEWWFWTAIGGGAALLVGIAVAIGVAVGGGQGSTTPTGIQLPPILGGM